MEQNVTWPPLGGNARGGQIRVLVAGLLVLGALAYMIGASLPQGTVYYQTVKELSRQATDPRPVGVAGTVAQGPIKRDSTTNLLQFEVVDGTDRLPVTYHGVVPDIFGPKIQVVVEGQRDARGIFQARTLLAKCPSRFQSAVSPPARQDQP